MIGLALLRAALDNLGGLIHDGAQQQVQAAQSAGVIFAIAAHIAHPGGEVGHGHIITPDPGEVGDETMFEPSDLALRAGGWFEIGGGSLFWFAHVVVCVILRHAKIRSLA